MLRLIGFVTLSVILTWPLGNLRDPALARHDDPLFSVWRLAWVAHQLPRDPAHLFDANIFFPDPNTFAYSDAMLLLGLLGAPFIWMGVHPIIVHNLLVIAAFVTAGLAMARLMAYFTADRTAQFIAALIFMFAPYRLAHIAHLELLWTAFLPLTLLALFRVLENPSVRRGVVLGVAVALQALCSIYYAVFLAIWLAAAVALSPLRFGWPTSRRHLAAFGVAALSAAIVLSPYLVPYARARSSLGSRTAHDLQMFSAQLSDYTRATPNHRLYPSERRGDDDERSLFPGVLATTLAVVSVFVLRTRTTTLLALLTVIAVDLSLGVNGLLFNLLRVPLPWLDSFRAPARFAVLTLLGISVLAGLAVERLSAAARTSTRRALAALLVAVLLGEYWAPLDVVYRPPLEPGPAERWLAAQPSLVVAALPLPKAGKLWGYETVFQYLSIFHWQPMVNGYSGNMPRHYLSLVWDLEHFPSEVAMAALRARSVQVVVFQERFTEAGDFDRLLYACQDQRHFSEVLVLQEIGHGRAAVCRVAPGP